MTEPRRAGRFAFIDALRGIAALAVVIFHLYSKNLVPMTGYHFWRPIDAVFRNGNLGVHVFFVISGFVIAQSIRGDLITPRYLGWFALRRSVRLDPPYWATIALMIVLTLVSNHAQHARSLPIPTVGAVAAHIVYLQGFFGYRNIVGVFWTLCYEIQFYLILVILMSIWQRTKGGIAPRHRWLWFVPLWCFALLCIAGPVSPTTALFVYGWPYFFLGTIVNWQHHREAGAFVFPLFVATLLLIVPVVPLPVSVATATALAILLVSRAGKLESWTLGPALQYLGRISYSLYLVHMLVGTPLARFCIRMFGKRVDGIHAVALMVAGIAVSIAAAHAMYVLVERPAMRLSHRLRRPAKGTA